MKTLKSTLYALVAFVCLSVNYQCATPKTLPIEEKDLTVQTAYFSEWYAGIDVGGTGFNVYFPNLGSDDGSIEIDSVFFRELKGELVKGRAVYSAILKHPTKTYENLNKAYKKDKALDIKGFSADLKPNECIIKYTKNGIAKYQKISSLVERVGTYYKNGPPELVVNHHIKVLTEQRGVADIDEEDEDY